MIAVPTHMTVSAPPQYIFTVPSFSGTAPQVKTLVSDKNQLLLDSGGGHAQNTFPAALHVADTIVDRDRIAPGHPPVDASSALGVL